MAKQVGQETDPLLTIEGHPEEYGATARTHASNMYRSAPAGATIRGSVGDDRLVGESFDDIPKAKRQLGLFSVVFLIFNRVIGTGIYATPSVILRTSGSVGVALLMWLLGALIAAAGTTVYIELGTVSILALIYRQTLNMNRAGLATQWRREELPGIHISSPKVNDDLCFFRVRPHNRELVA